MTSQGIAISMVYPVMKTLVHKGLDPEAFWRYASFDSRLLQDVEARIPGEELERLMKAAADYTQDDHFGLVQGQMTDIVDMGILGYVMMHSGTVAEALAAFRRYNVILCSGFNLDWEEQGEDVLLRLTFENANGRISRHCMEDMASSVYHLIGKLSHRRIPLHEVRFSHAAPADAAPYLSILGTLPVFGWEGNDLRMSKDVMHYPILYSDARLLGLFEPMADEARKRLTRGKVFSDEVYQWMMKCMPARFPTLGQTADALRMSTRSLQSKLKEESTSYNEISAAVRRELALSYLRRSEHSVGDIAYLLHFSEPSAFQSAFKKWTGVTPGQYRADQGVLYG
ncbi:MULTISPECIES: AraC family transcriptional regulator [Paenibacillus]|uniref:AraC family transcriptional regulator n=1 Tax=Paenibacillus TaxID=44249 RepID=UPI0022B93CE5|nr:AraC family transcriptional regulator [Paenibacillus caseinilyticus]MCZ8517902.1 AraC family transcriptional regulator [Paenibacillus caseinilyticus]